MAPLEDPDPPLADALVALRPWRADDVPEQIMGFADPTVLRYSWPFARPSTEADARARRDSVMFSLLPGELR